MDTLRDLASQLLNGESITHASREYALSDISTLPGNTFKATLTSERMRYSHAEPARNELDAVYSALLSLQMMGRFMAYASDDLLAKQANHQKKKVDATKQPKPAISKPIRIESERMNTEATISPINLAIDDPSTENMTDPYARERSIILKIVSR